MCIRDSSRTGGCKCLIAGLIHFADTGQHGAPQSQWGPASAPTSCNAEGSPAALASCISAPARRRRAVRFKLV
eukprot:10954749-Alexandrium_andersonii.AAC.1